VVAVDVASEDFLRDEHSKLFLFHALNIAQIGVCVNTIRRLIVKNICKNNLTLIQE
jgi:hypothetical protein